MDHFRFRLVQNARQSNRSLRILIVSILEASSSAMQFAGEQQGRPTERTRNDSYTENADEWQLATSVCTRRTAL